MGAGGAALVAGLLAILMSISIREFSFGSTLMIVGAIGTGSGLIVLALAQILREIRKLSVPPLVVPVTTARPEFPPRPAVQPSPVPAPDTPFPIPPRTPVAERAPPPERTLSSPPERTPPPRAETDVPPAAAAEARASRRNLLFRRSAESGPQPDNAPEEADASWPQSAARPPEGLWKRRRREPPAEPSPPAEPMLDLPKKDEASEAPQVTVLKSGVVDGMAYTLYSDGSIEAQLAEGTVRFASIEALRAHLDQRQS